MQRSERGFESVGDVIERFIAGKPSLAEIQGAIWGDAVDPRCTAEQRQALRVAELEAMRRGK